MHRYSIVLPYTVLEMKASEDLHFIANRSLQPCYEAEIANGSQTARMEWDAWQSQAGPPVPILVTADVWGILLQAVLTTPDSINHLRVFRLFMRRGAPRSVVGTTEIAKVRVPRPGVIRWEEGKYPSTTNPLRKGGNAFIRGDVELKYRDAWWMGREQTDLRILLAKDENQTILFSAWWGRGDSTRNGTDGDLWPVKLIIG